jgi:transposase
MDFSSIIEDLYKQIADLKDRIAYLEQENKALKEENVRLRQENDRLKERLGLNSTNSSLPPSRDLYRAKKARPRSGRKPGAQPGHKPQGYQLKTPDEIVRVYPGTCACGHKIEVGSTYQIHQKMEIPPIKAYVTEYHLYQGICRSCGDRHTAELPEGVSPDLLGDHAKAIISALSGFYHNSKRDVQQILHDIFHLPISLGLVSTTEKRVSHRLQSSYEELCKQMEDSPYLHIDETGHKCRGEKGWGWIFTNRYMSVLKLTSSRGKKVLESILPEYEGQIISDRYGAYRHFENEKRQICWSHLKRDFQRFAHSRNVALAAYGRILEQIGYEVFVLEKAFKTQAIDHLFFIRRIRKLKKRMIYALKGILRVPDCPHAHRVAQNLLNCFEMMWRFVDNREIEPTNNLAERQIRKYVVYRKKSLFTWSQRGNEFIERIFSLFLTCRLQNQSSFLRLSHLIAAPS